MQFIVTGYDGTDAGAMDRRIAARDEHLKMAESMKNKGNFICAAALLDDEEKMIGSILMVEFPSRKELDQWLKVEPYITGDVWRKVDVKPCKVPPMFMPSK
ncbi:YciI family protein [Alkaliphilus hydrothermalis]|uniref:Uncharacterized protein YciI n=1 Tax=Alkaliphilus hydrothermalis TaxID=1482730 RepID=A0ABS2NPU0_9FIRM|nr:YciI family protein [Alkaliphilus hydrothermalis]MBM7614937.1 uncharacterized protein YciI [Alkaliphilus hydrothermalis]